MKNCTQAVINMQLLVTSMKDKIPSIIISEIRHAVNNF